MAWSSGSRRPVERARRCSYLTKRLNTNAFRFWGIYHRFCGWMARISMNKNNLSTTFLAAAVFTALATPLLPPGAARTAAAQDPLSSPAQTAPPPRTASRSTMRLALPRREYLCAGGARIVILIETNAARLTLNSHIYNMKKVESDPGTKYSQGPVVWSGTGEDGFLVDNSDASHPKMLAEECHLQSSYPPAAPTTGSIKGTATFGEHPALPDDAVLIVQLRDPTHDSDDPAAVLAEERIPLDGRKSPVSFALTYDPAKITAAVPFGISASITGHGKLLFVLVKAVTLPDLTNPKPVRLALSRATANKGQTPAVPEAPPHF